MLFFAVITLYVGSNLCWMIQKSPVLDCLLLVMVFCNHRQTILCHTATQCCSHAILAISYMDPGQEHVPAPALVGSGQDLIPFVDVRTLLVIDRIYLAFINMY